MVTQPMDVKRVALSSKMLLRKQRTLAQLPLTHVYTYMYPHVLLDISKLLVVLVLQTLALLALLARLVNTIQENKVVMVSTPFCLFCCLSKTKKSYQCLDKRSIDFLIIFIVAVYTDASTPTCSQCTGNVIHAASKATYTCTTADDSRVSACAAGYFKTIGGSGVADTCTICGNGGATYVCAPDQHVSGTKCEGGSSF